MTEIWCVREDCPMCEQEDEIKELKKLLKKSKDLLREWRDKFGGQAVHRFTNYGGNYTATASPTDLLRDTNKFLEGK